LDFKGTMMSVPPLVSVIIPTLRRPALLVRALASVFAQSYTDFEVIVVVDGPDPDTILTLQDIADPRLQVVSNPKSLTAAGARNVGAARASGAFIAFLDDDDEWLPAKLEQQMRLANGRDDVLVTCLSRVVTPNAAYIWPEKPFGNDQPMDEYLFDRKSTFSGAAFIQTSSYLLARTLFERSPFRLDTPHDDWDFLLRLTKQFGVRVETVPEVLVVLYVEERRPSLSGTGSWAASLAWIDSIRPLLTRRGYSGLCLGVAGPRAANERAYGAFFRLLQRAFAYGAPQPLHLLAYAAFWMLPQSLRRQLRGAFSTRRIARRAGPDGGGGGAAGWN
jgi:glycosyltransferase involved in cell wall biosynthesis